MTAGISLIPGKTGAHRSCEKFGIRRIPLLAEEGWTRHEENVPVPIWRGRGGQFGEIFRPEHFAKLLLRLRPLLRLRAIALALRVGLALRATPSAALRWLRDFLLMPQPPLLCEEGNATTRNGLPIQSHVLRRRDPPENMKEWCADPLNPFKPRLKIVSK